MKGAPLTRRALILILIGVAAIANAASAHASVAYRGDFETGNFSQWHTQFIGGDWCGNACTIDNVGNANGSLVTSPAKGTHAFKCVVASTGGGASQNNRCEVLATQAQTGGISGQSWWYGWYTYFPGPSQTWWSSGGDWNDIFQFFDEANGQAFGGGGIDATSGHPTIYTEWPSHKWIISDPLKYNHWYHFVAHIKWSPSASVGFYKLNLDGVAVVPQTTMATMGQAASPSSVYSQGFYSARNTNNTVISDGFCRASTQTEAAAC